MPVYSDTAPKQGDSDNVLLQKIAQSLAALNTGGDSNNVLLGKIAAQLSGSVSDAVITSGDRTYYVAPSGGSDSNDGLSTSAPFATLQKAITVMHGLTIVDQNSNVIIQLMDGTHTIAAQINVRQFAGNGQVIIQGNTSDKTAVTLVAATASSIMLNFIGNGGCRYFLRDMTFQGNSSNQAINLSSNGRLTVGALKFTTGFTNFVSIANLSFFQMIGATYEIAGGASVPFLIQRMSTLLWTTNAVVTITGTPAWSSAFINLIDHAYARISVANVSFSGSATGTRYVISGMSELQTNGGGANFFPGNGAGTAADTSLYA